MFKLTEDEWERRKAIIEKALNDPATAAGRDKLYFAVHQKHPEISRRMVAAVLADDPVQQVHKPLNKRITTRPLLVDGPGKIMAIDLIDFQKLAGYNSQKRYCLTMLDVFSRYGWAVPLANKTQLSVTRAVISTIEEMPVAWRPKTIISDNGGEFQLGLGAALSRLGIKLIHTSAYAPQKNIERYNRSVKSLLFKAMTKHKSYRWLDFLQPIVQLLNTTPHGVTKYTPIELIEIHDPEVIAKVNERTQKKNAGATPPPDFSVGDRVRVALITEAAVRKQKFKKRIEPNWSSDVYQIYSKSKPATVDALPTYLLMNLSTNRKSKKRYFGYELQATNADESSRSSAPESVESDEEESDEEPVAPAAAAPPRRSARSRAPAHRVVDEYGSVIRY
jgi:transposase InsO family protein